MPFDNQFYPMFTPLFQVLVLLQSSVIPDFAARTIGQIRFTPKRALPLEHHDENLQI